MIEVEFVFANERTMPPGPNTVRQRAVVPSVPELKSLIARPGEPLRWLVKDVVFEYQDGFDVAPTVHVLCSQVGVPNWLRAPESAGSGS